MKPRRRILLSEFKAYNPPPTSLHQDPLSPPPPPPPPPATPYKHGGRARDRSKRLQEMSYNSGAIVLRYKTAYSHCNAGPFSLQQPEHTPATTANRAAR